MNMPFYEDMAANFLSGIALSMGDRLFSREASRHADSRVQRTTEQVAALIYLRDVHQSGYSLETRAEIEAKDEYRMAAAQARDYFNSHGKPLRPVFERGIRGLASRLGETIQHYKSHERINNLPIGKKFGTAFGIEFTLDCMVAVSQAVFGVGNAVVAIGESLYQGPALFAGMVVGKGILAAKDTFRSKAEKELIEKAKDLTRDNVIYDAIKDYNPEIRPAVSKLELLDAATTPKIDGTSDEKKSGFAVRALEKVTGVVSGEVKSIKNAIKSNSEAEKDAEEKRAADLRSKYDKY